MAGIFPSCKTVRLTCRLYCHNQRVSKIKRIVLVQYHVTDYCTMRQHKARRHASVYCVRKNKLLWGPPDFPTLSTDSTILINQSTLTTYDYGSPTKRRNQHLLKHSCRRGFGISHQRLFLCSYGALHWSPNLGLPRRKPWNILSLTVAGFILLLSKNGKDQSTTQICDFAFHETTIWKQWAWTSTLCRQRALPDDNEPWGDNYRPSFQCSLESSRLKCVGTNIGWNSPWW